MRSTGKKEPKKFADWGNLKDLGKPVEHPLSKPVETGPRLRKGEVPRKPSDEEIRKAIMQNAPMQPSNEQLFGHLVVIPEKLKQMEDKWNSSNDFFNKKTAPVEKQDLNKSWGRGPIDKEVLTEEEERIRQIPVDPSLTEGD